ncbi:ABC transporter ATP-binding protein [Aestuariimicrobium sp. T2.26MG-19.2B]|uniref:ABC transporter ATP-binding protein n=1 Tax=Aestuariimicrobium sp. T2.26MG-19.2B TaxID=3040679 RepID=UPI002477AD2C|nr:ABC transporter ATP-binding protein [Aestuariimicrobium sp. T2.26MG-19.2B]CAI9402472.1 Vitamin B12 import ATP-binding protein BtuD [Aestuariimicrobium sp. T2.26MG-19.2B]
MTATDNLVIEGLAVTTLVDSAETWLDHTGDDTRVDPSLDTDHRGSAVERLTAWRARHRMRRQLAEAVLARQRNPDRGLPVASNERVFAFLRTLVASRRRTIIALITFSLLAAVAGLIVPRILGGVVDRVTGGDPTLASSLNGICLAAAGVVLVQGALTYLTRLITTVFGQDLLSSAREEVVRTVLRLPLSRVETAGTGDLVTRVTRDVSAMASAAQWALPQFVTTVGLVGLTLVALFLNSPLLTIPTLLGMALLFFTVRTYLKHALAGYIAEGDSYSTINSTLTESVEGARTAEALGLQRQRARQTDLDVEVSAQTERYTMSLRNLMFLTMDYAFQGPLILVVVLGAVGYTQGWVTLGQVTVAALYLQQLIGPMDVLVQTLDRAQVGMASTTRLLGIAEVPQDRTPSGEEPRDSHLVGRDLRFAYREGHDVLHGVDLDLVPGERLAIVGPSGSGKSTLGRLLAGINGPRTGEVTVGGASLMGLPLDRLRTEVALVTQEHHVFVGTIRDNIVLARETTATEDEVREALAAVDALEWVERMPLGITTKVGSGNTRLTPAQAQQVALARLVIADPHTLVLDEATSLIDPQTARHLEGSMSSLLTGRTVVAIAHRLHTAHDADRIAVVIDGNIAELGSHDELMALDGEYAKLWRAWTS